MTNSGEHTTNFSAAQMTDWVGTTGAPNRKRGISQMVRNWHGDQARTHFFNPEKDCGVPESSERAAVQVAWQKLGVILAALNVPTISTWPHWLDQVIPISDERRAELRLGELPIGFWAGDIVTIPGHNPDTLMKEAELVRLAYDLDTLPPGDYAARYNAISADKKRMRELYCEKPYFYTYFNVGTAWWVNMVDGSVPAAMAGVSSVEFMVKYRRIPHRVLNEAYRPGGSVAQSGPRLDLASLAAEYAESIMIRNAGEDDTAWQHTTPEVLVMFARASVMPEPQLSQFLSGGNPFDAYPALAPSIMALDWSQPPITESEVVAV